MCRKSWGARKSDPAPDRRERQPGGPGSGRSTVAHSSTWSCGARRSVGASRHRKDGGCDRKRWGRPPGSSGSDCSSAVRRSTWQSQARCPVAADAPPGEFPETRDRRNKTLRLGRILGKPPKAATAPPPARRRVQPRRKSAGPGTWVSGRGGAVYLRTTEGSGPPLPYRTRPLFPALPDAEVTEEEDRISTSIMGPRSSGSPLRGVFVPR